MAPGPTDAEHDGVERPEAFAQLIFGAGAVQLLLGVLGLNGSPLEQGPPPLDGFGHASRLSGQSGHAWWPHRAIAAHPGPAGWQALDVRNERGVYS